MAFKLRAITAAALVAGLALAPAAQARDWHHGGWDGDGDWHGDGGGYRHHGGGDVGAAIGAGIIGFALGAAAASSQPYYAPPTYYAPPPAVYYGY